MPNAFSSFGNAMIPALQMIASRTRPCFFTDSTQARTLFGSERSHARGMVFPFTDAHAAFAFSTVRAVPTTRAPRIVRTRSDSRPRPELQPVTRIVLPSRLSPAVTFSALVPYPKPLGPFDLNN